MSSGQCGIRYRVATWKAWRQNTCAAAEHARRPGSLHNSEISRHDSKTNCVTGGCVMSISGARRFAQACKSTHAFGAIFRPSQGVHTLKIAKVETPRQWTQSIFEGGASTLHGFFVEAVRLHGPWLCFVARNYVDRTCLSCPTTGYNYDCPICSLVGCDMARALRSYARFGSVFRTISIP